MKVIGVSEVVLEWLVSIKFRVSEVVLVSIELLDSKLEIFSV